MLVGPESPPRAPLDAIWQELMLMGSAATIYVDDSGQRTLSIPRRQFNEQRGEGDVEGAAQTTYGIRVRRLDERWLLWRNGGWALDGGLLARARETLTPQSIYMGRPLSGDLPMCPVGRSREILQ